MAENLEGGKTRGGLPHPPPPGVPGACGEGEEGRGRLERGLSVYEAALAAGYSDPQARRLEWWVWARRTRARALAWASASASVCPLRPQLRASLPGL